MTLFELGDFVLNSGSRSPFKIECDSLTDADWDALARMVAQMVGPFSTVAGVPRGGLRIAEKLKQYATMQRTILIVDDVLTTGGSMERLREQIQERSDTPIIGAVVFARGQCPIWVRAVLQMPRCFWLKKTVR